MKKLWLLSMFLMGLFLYGCGDKTNISQSEIFDNDLKCQEFLEDYSKPIINYIYDENNYSDEYFLEEPKVFYSPVENTCIGYYSEWSDGLYIYNIESVFDTKKDASYVYGFVNFLDNAQRNQCHSQFMNIEFNEDCTSSKEDAEEKRLNEINYLKGN